MSIIDFVKLYSDILEGPLTVSFVWSFNGSYTDGEYSYLGDAKDFIRKYTDEYDALDGLSLEDLAYLDIHRIGPMAVISMAYNEPLPFL